ncbi:MAG: RNA polymerase sigma factor, partial [Micromonosporaceae bacterium]
MQPSPSVPPSRGRAPAGQGPAAAVDAAIARALAAGDPRGLEDAYRRYADRLRAYCRSIVHDAAAASDAVHDTYVVASQRAGELRDPGRLRAWLYAIARNECLRILRTQRRQAPLEAAAEMSGEPVDFAAGVRAEQLRELVHTASAGLADGDREVIELAIRHDLSAPDVASVLGVSPDHAHARLSRARASLERSLGALLVARTGTADCPELGTMLAGWDGQLTALLRKRLARHIASCEVCAERQRRQLQPSQLLAGFTALPFALVAEELWPRIQLTCGGYGPGPAGMGSDGVGSDGAAAGGTEPGGAAPGGAG